MVLFEQQYGSYYPFFYECQFSEAIKIARDEGKLVFVYLHDPGSPNTDAFCRGTMCTSLVVEFLDANFVTWGAVASGGEGLLMAMAMRAASFPFCAVAAPAECGDGISILQQFQVEGSVSPEELVAILQKVIDEQGSGLKALRKEEEEEEEEEEATRMHTNIREELDATYEALMQVDMENNEAREVFIEDGVSSKNEGKVITK